MSKYRIDDTQTTSEGKQKFIVQYVAGWNVPQQYEFDSLGSAQIRLEELEREDRALTEKDHDVINRAIEARAEWLASSDEKTGKKLLDILSKRHDAIGYQPYNGNLERKHALLRWQQSLINGLPPDRQEQFHEFKKSKGLER